MQFDRLMSEFRGFLSEGRWIDMELFCRDNNDIGGQRRESGEEGVVGAHKLVLASVSPVIRETLEEVKGDEDRVVVIIEGHRKRDLEELIKCIYWGKMEEGGMGEGCRGLMKELGIRGEIKRKGHDEIEEEELEEEEWCPLCLSAKSSHLTRSVLDPAGPRFKCCRCKAFRITRDNFRSHMEKHMSTPMDEEEPAPKKPYFRKKRPKIGCEVCGKMFAAGYFERTHSIVCGADPEDSISCDLCDRSGFTSQYKLQDHIRSKHTDERPYSCEYCDRRFATATHLYQHRATKHMKLPGGRDKTRELFQCGICNKVLSRRSKLVDHLKIVHERQRTHVCQFCGKAFSTKYNRDHHLNTFHKGKITVTVS